MYVIFTHLTNFLTPLYLLLKEREPTEKSASVGSRLYVD